MSYFAVGVVSSLIATPLNVYMVETLNSGEWSSFLLFFSNHALL